VSDSQFSEGRRAALERRRALAQGKAGLPPTRERTRTSVVMTAPAASTTSQAAMPAAAPAQVAASAAEAPPRSATTAGGFASELTGRLMSMLRRRQQSGGKTALAASAQAVAASTSGDGHLPAAASSRSVAVTDFATAPVRGHELARQMRTRRAMEKAASQQPARPARRGKLDYAPKVVVDTTAIGIKVTGLKYTDAAKVTGADEGLGKPVSGTQYISPRDAASRPPAAKVGLATTPGGRTVSGTLVRSRVSITGDEAGDGVRITGNAEGSTDADVTPREAAAFDGVAQFARQANPHGHTVFGTNLGRSLQIAGSRLRERARPIETTERGLAITGSAVGRSARVTGDEPGACRVITGDQYLAPAARQAECGGQGGGSASAGRDDSHDRRDPVTGAKVTVSSTWGGARITGGSVEHDPAVTGDEPGSCRIITGTPYQGPNTLYGWCDPATASEGDARCAPREAKVSVTGDLPLDGGAVTGTARGAERDITGTPYYQPLQDAAVTKDRVAAVAASFSIRTPQRESHLRNRIDPLAEATAASRITGTFAHGVGKITGNVEFGFAPRRAPDDREKLPRVSGEGSTKSARVTGDAWESSDRVTGTEGYIAQERNPSERGGKAETFAGSRFFKGKARHEDPRQIVTGMVGWSPKSAAKVTLSGGAQG